MYNSLINKSNLCSAWQRVKNNHGCAGADGISITKFESELVINLTKLQRDLQNDAYAPFPLMQIQVAKPNGGIRTLAVPTVRDRIAQTAALQIIEPILEPEFEDCSFAYRKGRSVKKAVYQIKKYYEQGYKWVVDADIEAFFDNVEHSLIVRTVRDYILDERICQLIEKWIRAEVYDGESLRMLDKGLPQGSVISPILANLFLDELDEEIMECGFKIVRYSDDFIILCKSREKAEAAMQLTDEILEKMCLDLDDEDTSVTSFDNGFKFLGVIFVRSLIMTPFDKPKKERKIVHIPRPLSHEEYKSLKEAT